MTHGYLVRRLAQVPPAVVGILAIVFLLVQLAPGDPILALAGETGDAAYFAEMRTKFGLDRPLAEQFASFVINLTRLDVGISYLHGRPAMDVILERVPATLLLTGSALALSSVVGVLLGVLAARFVDRGIDLGIRLLTLALHATPAFWLAQLLVLVLGLALGLLPVSGMTSARAPAGGFEGVLDVLRHLVLPVAVLASMEVAVVARLTRTALLDELGRDYVRTARAKGRSETGALTRHALRLALLPVVAVLGGRVGQLLAGSVVVEAVFGWPGVGRLLLTSVQARDLPIVLGVLLLIAAGVVLANLVTDLVHARLDPRIRLA